MVEPTYLSAAGSIINDLTGTIHYQVVSEIGAVVEVDVFMNKEKYQQY